VSSDENIKLRERIQELEEQLARDKHNNIRLLKFARTGRPTKTPAPGERMALGLKIGAEFKARLDRAAHETGRTQSQEAEARILHSFDREDLLTDVMMMAFTDKRTAGVILGVAHAIHLVALRHGVAAIPFHDNIHWLDEPADYAEVMDAAVAFLEAVAPRDPKRFKPKGRGRELAKAFMRKLARSGGYTRKRPDPHDRVSAIAALLGPTVKRLNTTEEKSL
jgi:hypothetical protein